MTEWNDEWEDQKEETKMYERGMDMTEEEFKDISRHYGNKYEEDDD